MNSFDIMSSEGFTRTMYSFGIVCLIFACGVVVVAFAYYGRTRDIYGSSSEKQRWTLLMGTWRDSLIITLLFVADALAYRSSEFMAFLQSMGGVDPMLGFVVVPVFSMIAMVLIFTVVIMRIIVISKWLASQRDGSEI